MHKEENKQGRKRKKDESMKGKKERRKCKRNQRKTDTKGKKEKNRTTCPTADGRTETTTSRTLPTVGLANPDPRCTSLLPIFAVAPRASD
jgi:hypothetical protein